VRGCCRQPTQLIPNKTTKSLLGELSGFDGEGDDQLDGLTADPPGLLSQRALRRTTHNLGEFPHQTEVIWNGGMFTILVAFDKNDNGQYTDIGDLTGKR
jgi:hypothetical protein